LNIRKYSVLGRFVKRENEEEKRAPLSRREILGRLSLVKQVELAAQ
jgi:hypothetical protein